MSLRIAAFTRRGAELGERLAENFGASLSVPARLAADTGARAFDSLDAWTRVGWAAGDDLLFIGACGIAVRAIAPYVKDKFTDPAVVTVDEAGRFAVPLLSGHVGGANALAVKIAAFLGGQAAVSTATDVNSLFAVDVFAAKNGLVLSDRTLAKEVSAALLEGQSIRLCSTWPVSGPVPRGVDMENGAQKVYITIKSAPSDALRLLPRTVTLGIGCRRGTDCAMIEEAVSAVLAEHETDLRCVARVCSIDLKKDEPGLLAFCRKLGAELITYTAGELMSVPGDFASSEFVRGVTGCDNVCARAAALEGGKLIIPKTARGPVTVAAALAPAALEF